MSIYNYNRAFSAARQMGYYTQSTDSWVWDHYSIRTLLEQPPAWKVDMDNRQMDEMKEKRFARVSKAGDDKRRYIAFRRTLSGERIRLYENELAKIAKAVYDAYGAPSAEERDLHITKVRELIKEYSDNPLLPYRAQRWEADLRGALARKYK